MSAATGDATEAQLREQALGAMRQAYAPYSRFRVGAALRGTDGSITIGCNVENASYPVGICAERGAVAAAVARGIREFDRLVIATESEIPASPCGMCRQVLAEIAPELQIVSVTTSGGAARWTMRELLPAAFTSRSLGR